MTPTELKAHPRFGSFASIALVCGVSREAVRHWKRIPAEHCRPLAEASGLTVYKLRPDVFGRAPAALKKTG